MPCITNSATMRSHEIIGINGGFEKHKLIKNDVVFSRWNIPKLNNSKIKILAAKGYNSNTALEISISKPNGKKINEKDGGKYIDQIDSGNSGMSKKKDETEFLPRVETNLSIPQKLQSKNMNLSVSAWIWSNSTLSTYLQIETNTGRKALSAFHSGSGCWEYITVVYPYSEIIDSFNIKLVTTKKGTAKFDEIRPVLIFDNRFENALNNRFDISLESIRNKEIKNPFRETVHLDKGKRKRIVIVGGSTIFGWDENINASISYILQSKLESIYPGKFEVLNYGLPAWTLQSQIVSIEKSYFYKSWNSGLIRPEEMASFLEGYKKALPINQPFLRYYLILSDLTLKNIDPDLIVLGTMWNDVTSVLFTDFEQNAELPKGLYNFFQNPIELAICDNIPCSVLYLKSLYRYMDDTNGYNLATAKLMYDNTIQQSLKYKNIIKTELKNIEKQLNRVDLNNFKSSEGMKIAINNSKVKYNFLMREFINRASKFSSIWHVTLPFKREDNTLRDDPQKMHYYKLKVANEIQNTVGEKVSSDFNIPFINLSSNFSRQYDHILPLQYYNLKYFNDYVHFTYRGNQWIADQIFKEMETKFNELSND